MKARGTVRLGFEVGSGRPVEIPIAHTFVCGQTQQSGKTTALQAIVERSGRRALAFLTKRGETLAGRRIRPFLPKEGDAPLHWRDVEVLMASAVEQRNLKWERLHIINATRGARTLEDVQANIRRLRGGKCDDRTKGIYELLDAYLDLVLPQMRGLHAVATLDLAVGLNVMDLSAVAPETQGMVIRAALAHLNRHETHVLTVIPEAWEFCPRDRSAPAKPEAQAMARKGAAAQVQNFLLVDSQDIAGVDPVLRQACSLWLIGVQRELNELKRAKDMLPPSMRWPKANEVSTLKLGEFFACWGSNVVKVYVQPSWLDDALAIAHAKGQYPRAPTPDESTLGHAAPLRDPVLDRQWREFIAGEIEDEPTVDIPPVVAEPIDEEETVTKDDAEKLTRTNEALARRLNDYDVDLEASRAESEDLRGQVAALTAELNRLRNALAPEASKIATEPWQEVPIVPPAVSSLAADDIYQHVKARLLAEAPAILKLALMQPSIEVSVSRPVLTFEEHSLKWRIVRLLADGFFETERKTPSQVRGALKRTGPDCNTANIGRAMDDFVKAGVFTDEGTGYLAVPGIRVAVTEAA